MFGGSLQTVAPGGGGGSTGIFATFTPVGISPTISPTAASPTFQPKLDVDTR
jgi:hypothetical protein